MRQGLVIDNLYFKTNLGNEFNVGGVRYLYPTAKFLLLLERRNLVNSKSKDLEPGTIGFLWSGE